MSQYPNQDHNSQQDQNPHHESTHHGYRPVYPGHGYRPGHGQAVASMVLGIISLVSFWAWGWVLAIIGIVLAVISRNRGYRGGMATAGLVCSIISLSLGLLIVVACTAFFAITPWWMWF